MNENSAQPKRLENIRKALREANQIYSEMEAKGYRVIWKPSKRKEDVSRTMIYVLNERGFPVQVGEVRINGPAGECEFVMFGDERKSEAPAATGASQETKCFHPKVRRV